ncbi:hypothetical protein [Mariniblastus fucicola]|uniref:Uncharacterized protein n=1 Tax=Mariniblastus fucicola TaxID=980251 RepID=A0A5B9PB14_9BACT|nr:hypothetical protein [Mariniblastus fucicola]QEG22699.1 hypothetical protein MFFC18_25820 [Mariniblastus fucicola]
MFVVVPIISSLFCGTILAYAVFAEGFDTRVNLYTNTWLNQRSGRMATSTISHVYSGMTPSFYRIEGPAYGMVNLPYGGRRQKIDWTDSGELVSDGEIRARTNHQLFTRCANEADGKLTFSFSGTGDSPAAAVRNDFDVAVLSVAFRSKDCKSNEVWFCGRVGPGEIGQAELMATREAANEMLKEIQSRGEGTVFARGWNLNSRSSRYYSRTEIEDVETAKVASALGNDYRMPETSLRNSLRREDGHGFVALTDRSINHVQPIDDAKVECEIHVVRGVR